MQAILGVKNAFSVGKGVFFNSILQQAYKLPTVAASVLPVRCASKKASSSKRNTGGKRRGKRLGLKKRDGEYVQVGMILVRQKGAYRWLPGSYVGKGRDRTLFAMEAGRVYFTREQWIPAPIDAFTKDVAPTLPEEKLVRTFVHIEPEPQVGRFKLLEQV
ncbi:39S ribosomal protein L27, mitochondrial-like isoform X2 [Anneissia japonica]|uniref:39S ribosomal protein L27, mitochondrial-like isoform X1 n=1 Tax=Anneissia japonica TaxID=1529436 RepID=UPI001425531F|nr:39S ribosomal protein L27, mitochondrial-like isoform X1 [Anneissia japonica]XP_033121364.1 39S ribosomal protein L27, mitochondrial-like isoform X2 [Anneissia japonica]